MLRSTPNARESQIRLESGGEAERSPNVFHNKFIYSEIFISSHSQRVSPASQAIIALCFTKPTGSRLNQRQGQVTYRSIDLSNCRSIDRSINRSIDRSVNRSIYLSSIYRGDFHCQKYEHVLVQNIYCQIVRRTHTVKKNGLLFRDNQSHSPNHSSGKQTAPSLQAIFALRQ